VALTATVYNFDIELANVDRSVYETPFASRSSLPKRRSICSRA
jgi:uncharacterized protein YaeQ